MLLAILSFASAVSAFTTDYNHNIKVAHEISWHDDYLYHGRRARSYSERNRVRFCNDVKHSAETNNESTSACFLSTFDSQQISLAAKIARIGYGNTYPNPAVGCVLVRHNDSSNVVIGSGFHPKAGMPHAEVFALFEACGHAEDGVEAARSVMSLKNEETPLKSTVLELLDVYKCPDGASNLFGGHFSNSNVTAYVTLEPCCHVGQTPPCALSLVKAGIKRVVVGFGDPNPRVDGGGIQILKDSGVEVYVMNQSSDAIHEKEAAIECASLIPYFVKRISTNNGFSPSMYDNMTGKKNRLLRAMALRKKTDGDMPSVEWPKGNGISTCGEEINFLNELEIDHRFLEIVDKSLFDHELVILRLSNIVNKKKGAKVLGERVAELTSAYVAQVLGHTVLLYRPGVPPILDLDELT